MGLRARSCPGLPEATSVTLRRRSASSLVLLPMVVRGVRGSGSWARCCSGAARQAAMTSAVTAAIPARASMIPRDSAVRPRLPKVSARLGPIGGSSSPVT